MGEAKPVDIVAVAALADLAIECLDADPEREADLLRAGAALVTATIASQQGAGAAFATAIAGGAYESAALRLIPLGASYMLSRSAAGQIIATVKVPGREEVTLEARTAALAILACLATALARKGKNLVPAESRAIAFN